MAYINPNITSTLTLGTAAQFGAATTSNPTRPDNNSDDPSDWTGDEQLRMFTWFMKMHHEEDIKGFKAMRDIERSVEAAEQEELLRKQMEFQRQFMLHQQQHAQAAMNQAQNAYQTTSTASGYYYPAQVPDEKESWWKRLLK